MGTFQIPLLAAIDRVESATPRSQPSARREFQLGGEGLNQAASPVDRADRCRPNDPALDNSLSLSLSPRWGLEENKKERVEGEKKEPLDVKKGAMSGYASPSGDQSQRPVDQSRRITSGRINALDLPTVSCVSNSHGFARNGSAFPSLMVFREGNSGVHQTAVARWSHRVIDVYRSLTAVRCPVPVVQGACRKAAVQLCISNCFTHPKKNKNNIFNYHKSKKDSFQNQMKLLLLT